MTHQMTQAERRALQARMERGMNKTPGNHRVDEDSTQSSRVDDANLPLGQRRITRRVFAAAGGLTVAGLIGAGVLSRWGVTQQAVARGEVVVHGTPTRMIVTHRNRCSGCQRCELACALRNDGRSSSELARIKVYRNYFFGNDFDNHDGIYDNCQFTQDFCKQCAHALCMANCPMGAIHPEEGTGTRVVNHERCIGCGICHEVCPWHMPVIDRENAKSNKCVACGRCARQCPNKAIDYIEWEDICDEILRQEGRPQIDELIKMHGLRG